MYNALAAGKVLPNQPTPPAAPTPAQATKPAAKAPAPSFNSKPDKNVNQGAMPAMVGDRQKIARPPVQQIAASPGAARPPAQSSGIESAMGSLADKMHPVKRR